MTHAPAKIVFGGGVFVTSTDEFSKPENIAKVLNSIKKHGITTIDTSRAYGECEKILGQANASTRFTIDTKGLGGMNPQPSSKDVVIADAMESLKMLNTKSVSKNMIIPDFS